MEKHKKYDCFISLNKRKHFGIGDSTNVTRLNFIVFDFDQITKEDISPSFFDFKDAFVKKWNLSEENYFLVRSGFGFHFILAIDLDPRLSSEIYHWGLNETMKWNNSNCRVDVLSDPARVIRIAGTWNHGRKVEIIQSPERLIPVQLSFQKRRKRKQEKVSIKFDEIPLAIDPNQINWRRSIIPPCLVPKKEPRKEGSHQFRLIAGICLTEFFDIDDRILAYLFKEFDDFSPEISARFLSDLRKRQYGLPGCGKRKEVSKGFAEPDCDNCNDPLFWFDDDCLSCIHFLFDENDFRCRMIRQFGFCYREEF